MNVRRLYDQAIAYYHVEHSDATGRRLGPRFPESAPRTPAAVPCGAPRAPSAEDWSHPTWQALDFALWDAYYHVYQFDSEGVGSEARFTVSAFGDLDCDGVYPTFLRFGTAEAGDLGGGPGLYLQNELE
jgi:hypothetical protein